MKGTSGKKHDQGRRRGVVMWIIRSLMTITSVWKESPYIHINKMMVLQVRFMTRNVSVCILQEHNMMRERIWP